MTEKKWNVKSLLSCLLMQIIQNLSIYCDLNVNCPIHYCALGFTISSFIGKSPAAHKIILMMNCVLDEMLIMLEYR